MYFIRVTEHGRGRPKVKIEDTSDQATPSAVHKKRAALESEYQGVIYV